MIKRIVIPLLVLSHAATGWAIVKNSDDTDLIIAGMDSQDANFNLANSQNPFGDPKTFYCRSMIKISGGPSGNWYIRNVGNPNSFWNEAYTFGRAGEINGFSPLLVTNIRLIGGIGLSSSGLVPGNSTPVAGSWTPGTTAAAALGLPSGTFPSLDGVWAVKLSDHAAYVGGATWANQGPQWPMNQDRALTGENAPVPKDFHTISGGLQGETRPEWTDQPIVVSLDFATSDGEYHRGVQLHFARSNDYWLPSENKLRHPNPWQNLDPNTANIAPRSDGKYWEFLTEEPVPGVTATTTWHPSTATGNPSNVRCELFDQGDYRTMNYGVQKIEVDPQDPNRQKVILNTPRQLEDVTHRSKRNRYRLINAPQFLRHPGQMYFESTSGWLFFKPYIQPASDKRIQVLNVSLPYPYREDATNTTLPFRIPDSIIRFEKARNIALQHFEFDTFMANGVKMLNTQGVYVNTCLFRNIGSAAGQLQNAESLNTGTSENPSWVDAGLYGCEMANSYKCMIDHSDERWDSIFLAGHFKHQGFACGAPTELYYSGNQIKLNLPPPAARPAWISQNLVSESYGGEDHVSHESLRSYGQVYPAAPGFDLRGNSRGLTVEGNSFEDGSSLAIWGHGSRGQYRNNVITSCVRDTTDSAAIYMGRELLSTGNVIEDNVIRHAVDTYGDYTNRTDASYREEVAAIMLDDGMFGQTVKNNVFDNVDVGITVNAGRYNLLERNKFNKVNRRMLKMEAAIPASSGFLLAYYGQAKLACGTSPFNDPLTNPDRITFTHSAWSWYKTVGAYSYWTTSTFVPDDLEELNRMKGESQSAWKNDPFNAGWLDTFAFEPGNMELVISNAHLVNQDEEQGIDPPRALQRSVTGYRNLFVYAQSDIGIVPANELAQLNGDNGGSTGTLFEMGINYRPSLPSGGSIGSYYYQGDSATFPSQKTYRKNMYGLKVTTP